MRKILIDCKRIGIATAKHPAVIAADTPARLSSIATHLSGDTLNVDTHKVLVCWILEDHRILPYHQCLMKSRQSIDQFPAIPANNF